MLYTWRIKGELLALQRSDTKRATGGSYGKCKIRKLSPR